MQRRDEALAEIDADAGRDGVAPAANNDVKVLVRVQPLTLGLQRR